MEEKAAAGQPSDDGIYFGDLIKLDVLFVDIWKAFKKYWWLCLLLVAGLSALAYGNCKKSYVPQYTAKASFSISTVNASSGASGAGSYSSYYNSSVAEQLSKTFGIVINSSTMRQILMNELGVNGLNGVISAKNDVANAPLFTITVTSSSPKDAYDILNAVIENYPRLAQYVLGETSMSIYSPAQYPTAPSNHFSYKRKVVIAAALGVLLSAVLLVLTALFKSTVRKKEDVEERLNQKCLAQIPWVEVKKRGSNKKEFVTISQRHADFSEAFRYLKRRTAKRLDKKGSKVLAVTSAYPNEGKTTVSYNLALAFANSGKRVALLDTDFSKMSIQSYLGITLLGRGITDYLCGDCTAQQAGSKTELDNFQIFFAGTKKLKKYPGDAFSRLIDYLRESYDYVIMDAAPCAVVSDTAQVINLADETLFVVRQDYTSVKKLRNALGYVYDLGADVIGVVFNGVRAGFTGYKGGYYYGGYYSKGYYGKKYGSYGKKYGYYGNGYGKSYGHRGYGSGYGSGYGYDSGYGSYDYGYGYSSGGKRIDENITDIKGESQNG